MSLSILRGRTAFLTAGAALAVALAATAPTLSAQQAPATPSAWSVAPIDLTGYWVSVVNEDWRWRMVTPPRGNFDSIPLNQEGQKVLNSWDPATDGSCLAFGAAGVMRIPGRLHITWDGDNVLKIETDAGVQTRRLMFDATAAPGPRSLQGFSQAVWQRPGGGALNVGGGGGGGRGGGGGAAGGSLLVTTSNMQAAWLRKNGVPYSENAKVTEYYDRFNAPNGDQWFTVTTIVEDPLYLNQPFVTSTHFKREADASKWAPAPCKP